MDFRDEVYWFISSIEKRYKRERNDMISSRIGSSLDNEPFTQRLSIIDFELQKLELEKKEWLVHF